MIATRFLIGISIAGPAINLCINRRLYLLASTSVLPSKADKRREIIIDLAIGIGLPIVIMILCLSSYYLHFFCFYWLTHNADFFAQDFRFLILEDFGCATAISSNWVAGLIINVPPMLVELIAGVYGCLSIHAFCKRRSQLIECLSSQDLNMPRYITLMGFSVYDLLTGIPIAVFYLYHKFREQLPFPGLSEEHHHFSQVLQVPAVLWRATMIDELNYELDRWLMVSSAFVLFAIFGFTQEARDKYRAVLQSVVRVFITMTGIKFRSRPGNKAEGCVTFFYSSTDILSMLFRMTFQATDPDQFVDILDSDRQSSSMI